MPVPPARGEKRTLDSILLQMGAVDALQMKAAEAHVKKWGVSLGTALIELGFCSKDDYVRAQSMLSGYPVIALDSVALDLKLLEILSLKHCEQYRAIPLRVQGQRNEVIELAFSAAAIPDMGKLDGLLKLIKRRRAV